MTPGQPDSPATGSAARFVVLLHQQADGSHYDLMIDRGAALAAWRCPIAPDAPAAQGLRCERIGDHRRAYLDYQGPLSGGRGTVRRHDAGMCLVHRFDAQRVEVVFHGRLLRGPRVLVREGPSSDKWSLTRSAK